MVDQDIIDPTTGEVIIAAGERIPAAKTDPLAKKIQDAGVNDIYLRLEGSRGSRHRLDNFVDAAAWLSEREVKKAGINEMVHLPTLKAAPGDRRAGGHGRAGEDPPAAGISAR